MLDVPKRLTIRPRNPAFQSHALKYRRCIIPANGFYEWKVEGNKKKPLYVKLKDDSLMMFAGLWDHRKAPDGLDIESCMILTTITNDLLKPLHDRMSVIFDPEDIDLWLNPHMHDIEQHKPLFRPYPTELKEIYPVSDVVNNTRDDWPECMQKVIYS